MAKFFYQVIKDGEVIAKRKSDRTYTHAVVLYSKTHWARQADGRVIDVEGPERVKNVSYAGSLALATKAAGVNYGEVTRTEIIPLTVTQKGA